MTKLTANVRRGLVLLMDLGLIQDHPDGSCICSKKEKKRIDAAIRWLEEITDKQKEEDTHH